MSLLFMEMPRYWIYQCVFFEKIWLGLKSQDQWSQNLTWCIIYFALDLEYILRITNVNWNAKINWSILGSNIWWKHVFYAIQEGSIGLSQKSSCIFQGTMFSTKQGRTGVWWCNVDFCVHLSEKSLYLFTIKLYQQTCLHVAV